MSQLSLWKSYETTGALRLENEKHHSLPAGSWVTLWPQFRDLSLYVPATGRLCGTVPSECGQTTRSKTQEPHAGRGALHAVSDTTSCTICRATSSFRAENSSESMPLTKPQTAAGRGLGLTESRFLTVLIIFEGGTGVRRL